MKHIKGPGIFLAQFMGVKAPNNDLKSMCDWAAGLGYKAIQIPTWEASLIDLEMAATSQDYCDELIGVVQSAGLEISELSTHLQGQLVAVNPAFNDLFEGFAPAEVAGKPAARQRWAEQQLVWAAQASQRLGLTTHATFSGALLWHTFYPWPQRPSGLVEAGFAELAQRWTPILNAFDAAGVDVCYEIHPGEDLHDGASFERFLEATKQHSRVNILYDPSHFRLQHLDYLAFIDLYHDRIKAFHVKDAEFNSSGRVGVYGGYLSWQDRAGRFRSLGDGDIDFSGIFSKLTQYGYDGWAVLEWECCIKDPEEGAREGVDFINRHIIKPTETSFDDFASVEIDRDLNRRVLGLIDEESN